MNYRDIDWDDPDLGKPAHNSLGKRGHAVPEKEKRTRMMSLKVSQLEADNFYLFCRSHRGTMSYFIRKALEDHYPEVFANANRYIKKPRKKPKGPLPQKTRIVQSFDGTRISVDVDPNDLVE